MKKGERSASRRGYRFGHYPLQLTIKVGIVELKVPHADEGPVSTLFFDPYRRSEKTLFVTLAEMYVKGASTRKVTKLAETLCGHDFSRRTISNMVVELDDALQAIAARWFDDTVPS